MQKSLSKLISQLNSMSPLVGHVFAAAHIDWSWNCYGLNISYPNIVII